jgi:hypothetical protein
MDWEEALEIVIARTRHEAFRRICADANPDIRRRDAMRSTVVRVAMGEPAYPPVRTMAGNLARAAFRVAGAVAAGKPLIVDRAEKDRRLTICTACDQYDAPKGRCKACGCAINLKARLKSETGKCPKMKW